MHEIEQHKIEQINLMLNFANYIDDTFDGDEDDRKVADIIRHQVAYFIHDSLLCDRYIVLDNTRTAKLALSRVKDFKFNGRNWEEVYQLIFG